MGEPGYAGAQSPRRDIILSLINRGQYSTSVENEFQHLVSQLRGLFSNLLDTDGNLLPGDTPSGLTPIGSVLSFAGAEAPPGWVLADGRAVSRVRYAALFRVIGTTYGVGDGSTSFNVPDLRGRFPLAKSVSGIGDTLGATGGSLSSTTSSDGSHDHSGSVGAGGGHDHSFSVGSGQGSNPGIGLQEGVDFVGVPQSHTHDVAGNTSSESNHSHSISSDGAHTHTVSAPPFLVVNAIVFAGA